MRLSSFLALNYPVSKRYAKKLIRNKLIKVNGKIIKTDVLVYNKDIVNVEINLSKTTSDIYDASKYLIESYPHELFFYKPPNIHTERNRITDGFCLSDVVDQNYPGYKLISRLDMGVDGVVAAVEKDYKIEGENKEYLAWVRGEVRNGIEGKWSIDADKRKKVKVNNNYSGPLMTITPIKILNAKTLIKIILKKAARHQIRAVCSFLGFPIIGDPLYGLQENQLEYSRIYLHCYRYDINGHHALSPKYKEFMEFDL